MPSGKTHLAVGIGTALAMGSAITLDSNFATKLALTTAICVVGALAPDLDIDNNELEEMSRTHTGSFARRARGIARDSDHLDRVAAWTFGTLFRMIGEVVSRLLEALAWCIQRVTTHRGMTHSFLAWSFTTAVALFLSQRYDGSIWWGLCWSAGYASHILSDAMTWSGIKPWQPWNERRAWLVPKPLRFRVGTWRDTVLRVVSPFVGLGVLLWQQRVLELWPKF
jgi:membrane-bound metal-dependent hydrolase YbcI (DUF457 family)